MRIALLILVHAVSAQSILAVTAVGVCTRAMSTCTHGAIANGISSLLGMGSNAMRNSAKDKCRASLRLLPAGRGHCRCYWLCTAAQHRKVTVLLLVWRSPHLTDLTAAPCDFKWLLGLAFNSIITPQPALGLRCPSQNDLNAKSQWSG